MLLFDTIATSLTLIVCALIGVWQAFAGRGLREVKNQVANRHGGANLRADIDCLKVATGKLETKVDGLDQKLDAHLAGLRDLVHSQGHQIGEIRADLRKTTTT
ncbi:MAG: hypothetical protein LBD77_02175 [Bifidobacteriaceae bacterium]|nr:hypothetical protein [Bifidobacteriaceae bacterium]